MTRDEIKSFLDYGDYVKIARIVGTDRKYVYQVLTNPNKGQRGKGKLVLEEAEKLALRNILEGKSSDHENNSQDTI
jgi:hypothetical protein